jgi:UDP-N-acetylglucosamine/UDP-N-acetyl-alpha-D-glucosaminouronate 4-epimerase
MTWILVTGGAGFIGSHLVEALVRRGARVRVLDNLATGFRRNLAAVASDLEFVEGDVRDCDAVCRALQRMDLVYHQAALPSVARSVQNPLDSNHTNITGTLNVLTAARDAGLRRVVMASSSSVYGSNHTLPKDETMTPAPLSPYAVTKYTGEMYARVFSQLYGLETVCLRYFNVFGPRQDPTTQYAGAIAKFISCARRGEPYPVFGDGEQSRDFTYVENVVEANVLAAEAPVQGHAVLNIAYGERATLNQIIAILNQLTNQNLPTVFSAARPGDVRHSLASIARAREVLGYTPRVALREGLEKTLRWYQEQGA